MDDIKTTLSTIEDSIRSEEERGYFWTHEVRYLHTLLEIQKIANRRSLTILDIGCFPYHIGFALEEAGHKVFGISSYHEKVKKDNVVVINIETEKFPYKNNFFDLVLCNEVIEHLPQSPIPMLSEIYRVAKKDGFLMVTTPNIARSINRAKLLLGKSIMYPVSVYFEGNGKGNNIYHRHNREYTYRELCFLFKNTGFAIDQAKTFISYTPFRKRKIADRLLIHIGKVINYYLMQIIPSLRDTLLVVGRK